VQSKDTQKRIQQELSQRLGTTLRIRRISVTPWFVEANWDHDAARRRHPSRVGDFLQADTFRLRILASPSPAGW
jgi:hypothetical protein